MDPVTMSAALAAFAPEMIGMEAALVAAPEVMAGIGAGTAGAAGATAATAAALPTLAEAMSPLALEAGGGATAEALSPVASEMYGGAQNVFAGAAPTVMDKFKSYLDKAGPKLAGQVGADMMNEQAPRPQAGSARMPGSQQQTTTTEPFDYGGAAVQPVGAAERLNISDEELKRLLMSLRGY
jgi:hypothetical protein